MKFKPGDKVIATTEGVMYKYPMMMLSPNIVYTVKEYIPGSLMFTVKLTWKEKGATITNTFRPEHLQHYKPKKNMVLIEKRRLI